MTKADRLSLLRLITAPLFAVVYRFMLMGGVWPKVSLVLLWLFFIIAELSDLLDGFVARKTHSVTDTGKLLDPFTDVVSRVTYFFLFTIDGFMPAFALYIILFREFIMLFVRMLMIKEGTALAASSLGKAKSFVYFLTSAAGLISATVSVVNPTCVLCHYWTKGSWWAFWAAALLALVSLGHYLVLFQKSEAGKKFFSEGI